MTTDKKFTQLEVNSLLAREKKKWEDDIAQRDTVIEAAKARVAELETLTATLTSERDDARTQAEASTTQHATLRQQHEGTLAEHRRFRVSLAVTQALVQARVLPQASTHATEFLKREAQLEHDASDNIVAVGYRGQRYESLTAAAAAFLRDHDFLASGGRPVGGGSRPPTAGGLPHRTDLLTQDPRELAQAGWRETPKS